MVIPCLNDAQLLERCLRSIDRQHRPADVTVVVDNGSDDDSAPVAAAHGATVVHEPRRGITRAAAAGYGAACELGTDYIVRTDADAWLPESYLETVEQQWAAATTSTVGLTGPALFDGTPHLISRLYLSTYRFSVGSALGHPPFFGTNSSFRTEWWQSVRRTLDLADTESHDDIQLSFAVRPGETIRFVPELVVGMDNRALRGRRQLRRRFLRGWHSMMRGFSFSPPWQRIPQRLMQSRPGDSPAE
nr:cell wall biosynthesis glycosyltransferase [Streptococcus thermophilus]